MDLDDSIKKTCDYAKFFDFFLFPSEIHHWLISSKKVPKKYICSEWEVNLNKKIITARRRKTINSLDKIIIAKKLVRVLRWIPGLRLVAITGSVAAGNSKLDDDIDLLIVTSSSLLWVVRPIILITISVFFRRRLPHEDPSKTKDAFCPNLWLDTKSLRLPKSKRSLYSAHEILQIMPLLDYQNTYFNFLNKNSWISSYLANAYYSKTKQLDNVSRSSGWNVAEIIAAPINMIFFLIQLAYMLPKKSTEKVGPRIAYLHTRNYSKMLNNYLK